MEGFRNFIQFVIISTCLVISGCSWNEPSPDRTIVAKPYEYTYGGRYLEEGNDVIQTQEGQFLIVGKQNKSESCYSYNGYILKISNNGLLLWERVYFQTREFFGVIETSEGDYIVLAEDLNYDCALIKISRDGEVLWIKKYGSKIYTYYMSNESIKLTSDGGFIITGGEFVSPSTTDKKLNIIVIKTDSDGTEQWRKYYGNNEDSEYGLSLSVLDDGGYIISGWDDIVPKNYTKAYIIRIDGFGKELWSIKYDEPLFYTNFSCRKLLSFQEDGNLFLINKSTFGEHSLFLKTDDLGNIIWINSINASVWNYLIFSAIETDDGSIMMAGSCDNRIEDEDSQVYIIKTDNLGNILWEKTYDLDAINKLYYKDMAYSLKEIGEGQYILSGVTAYHFHEGDVEGDIFLMKIDDDGNMLGF